MNQMPYHPLKISHFWTGVTLCGKGNGAGGGIQRLFLLLDANNMLHCNKKSYHPIYHCGKKYTRFDAQFRPIERSQIEPPNLQNRASRDFSLGYVGWFDSAV